jgi:hypothetical protein
VITLNIKAPFFDATVKVDAITKLVTAVPPVLTYMRGWTEKRVREYAEGKRWQIT